MSFHRWLQNLRSALASGRNQRQHRRRVPARRDATHRSALEILEDRCLLSFSPAVSYPAGANPQAVVTADFNNDGRLDLATANTGDNTVGALLGNSNGTFQPAQTSGTGASPVSVAVGDFDGDGKLDLATANAGDVSVLRGNGNSTFGAASNIDFASLGSSPASVAVGDFNGDGKMDLGVTSNVYTPGYYGPGYWGYYGYYPGNWYPGHNDGVANVLIGDGHGSFAPPNTTWLGTGTHNTALAADLNGDGCDDFVTLNADYGYVSVLLGDSSGALQGPSAFATGSYSNAVAAGDLDADGNLDLVTTNYQNVWVLPGDGAGGFATPQNYGTGSGAASVVLGDFNRDTHLDIATANASGESISVLRGRSEGYLTVETFTAGPGAYALAAGDFNGDGWLDAVTNASGNSVSVLLNDQSWPFVPPSVSVSDAAAVTEGNSGTVNATFTLTLAYASIYDVTVHYVTADLSAAAGSDYVAASADVIIPAGHTSATFTVAVKGDHVAEPTETFAVNLTAATNATIADGQGIGTILDDEPRISINDTTATEGDTGTRPATFTVNLSAAYDEPVVIGYATANDTATAGSDYQAASGTLTIPAGQTSGTFTVLVNGDRTGEPNETFLVNLSSPSNAAIADGQGAGTIVDDEPRISINDTTVTEGNTGTRPATFTVNLSAAYDMPVTISYATANNTATAGTDYQAASGTLTIPAGQTSGTITVLVNGDKSGEPNETFLVNLSNPGNAVIADGQGAGTITDDEPRVSINDVTRAEGSKGQKPQFTFTVTLSAASDKEVKLSFHTVNGTATTSNNDYAAKNGTLTFKPGETTKTITITVKGDPYPGRDETFYVDLFGLSSNAQFGKSRGIGMILNDD